METQKVPTLSLGERWSALRQAEPRLKIREAAHRLGTSEASLLEQNLGRGVRRLRNDPARLLPRLEALGDLMALTRNDGAVHERHGVYSNLQIAGNVGLVNNSEIDLRIDFSHWHRALAEVKLHAGRTLRSLQFFDDRGTAVHKVYLENEERAADWETLVEDFLDPDQTPSPVPDPVAGDPPPGAVDPDPGFDPSALVAAWKALKDPHHFHQLLKRHRAGRREAFAAAQGTFTRRVSPDALESLLTAAASQQVPIMVFVGNPGCIQIHTGPVSTVGSLGTWRNVMDPRFNLHVDLRAVAEAWVVEKPSPEGLVSSLELLGPRGELTVQVFGKRKPGVPELPAWKDIVDRIR